MRPKNPRPSLARALLPTVMLLVLLAGWWRSSTSDRAGEAFGPQAHPGLAVSASRPSPDGHDDKTAANPSRIAVCGDVRDAISGRPLPQAVVNVRPFGEPAFDGLLVPGTTRRPLWTVTGRDGGWGLDEVPSSSSYGISVSAAGYRPAMTHATPLRPCNEDVVAIALHPGGVTLEGRVTDATGGELSGATVLARPMGTPSTDPLRLAPVTAIADDEGGYRITVEPGFYDVVARFPGYAVDRHSIELVAAQTHQDFALLPGGRIEGRVVLASTGDPVAGARVLLAADRAPTTVGGQADALTDAEGRFVVDAIAPGEVAVVAHASEGRTVQPTVVEMPAGGYVEALELLLEPSPSISGVVIERDDPARPIARARVVARGEAGTWISGPSDEHGRFTIEAVAPGDFQVSVRADGHVDNLLAASVHIGQLDVSDLTLSLDPGMVLNGDVVNGGPDTTVRLVVDTGGMDPREAARTMGNAFATARCDERGHFRLENVAEGRVSIVAEDPHRGVASANHIVSAASNDRVRLELAVDRVLRGQVLDHGVGRPGLRLGFSRVDAPASRVQIPLALAGSSAAVLTDAQGRFATSGLEPGAYRVRVYEGADPLAMHEPAHPIDLPTERDVDVTIVLASRAGIVEGELRDGEGSPVPDAIVRARLFGQTPKATLSDRNGGFMVRGYPPGAAVELVITDAAPGGASIRRMATVGEAVSIVIPRGQTLRVTVDGVGRGQLLVLGPRSIQRTLVADATLEFVRMEPGHYELQAIGEDGVGLALVELTDADATVRLRAKAWATVRGRLVDDSGPLADWAVLVRDGGGRFRPHALQRALLGQTVRTRSDGEFDVDGVFPGPGEIFFLPPDTQPGRTGFAHPIDARAGASLDVGDVHHPSQGS